MHYALTLCGQNLHLLPSGAAWWPDRRLLCLSDLHLGKSERMARRGGALLPPYEVTETLSRLDDLVSDLRPEMVICLGDSFDDAAAVDGIDSNARLWLLRLMAGREWVWVQGNHDAGPLDIAGTHRAEVTLPPLTFRHIAETTAVGEISVGEISGHYHPKARLAGGNYRAFLTDARRLILPAFGTYTGGLWADDPAFAGLMGQGALAILCMKGAARAIPLATAHINKP